MGTGQYRGAGTVRWASVDGKDARLLRISASPLVWRVDSKGALKPSQQQITITAHRQNIETGADVEFKVRFVDALGEDVTGDVINTTVTGDLCSFYIPSAQSDYDSIRIVASLSLGEEIFQDTAVITKVADGAPGNPELDYLKDSFKDYFETGLIITTFIAATDSNGNVMSFQNGDPLFSPIAFAAGVENFGVENETQKALIRHDGSVKFTVGEIGPFVISTSNLVATSGDDSMLLSSSLIRFIGKYSRVHIGADTVSNVLGGAMLATQRIEVNRNLDDPFPYGNVGHYFSVEGEKAFDDDGSQYSGNHALYIAKGDIAGVRFRTRRVSGTTNLTVMDTNVIVTANNAVIWLPNNPEDGQMYWINPNGFSATIRSSQNIWDNSGNTGTSNAISGRVWNFFLYDKSNSRWLKSWLNA
jgi:hypothetical protein